MTTVRLRDAVDFAVALAQEFPRDANPGIVLDLMRLARRHHRLQEDACNHEVPEGHDEKIEARITAICDQLPGCVPLFSGDPRGCTVKLKVPSGRSDSWGGVGICVPQ